MILRKWWERHTRIAKDDLSWPTGFYICDVEPAVTADYDGGLDEPADFDG